jgi:accessory gene regulator protein AgrB
MVNGFKLETRKGIRQALALMVLITQRAILIPEPSSLTHIVLGFLIQTGLLGFQ